MSNNLFGALPGADRNIGLVQIRVTDKSGTGLAFDFDRYCFAQAEVEIRTCTQFRQGGRGHNQI